MLEKLHVQAFDPAVKVAVEEVLADRTMVEPLVAGSGKVTFANVSAESSVPHRVVLVNVIAATTTVTIVI